MSDEQISAAEERLGREIVALIRAGTPQNRTERRRRARKLLLLQRRLAKIRQE